MIEPAGLTRDPGPFKLNLKCCTYFPYLPNFGIGMMLEAYPNSRVRLEAASQRGLLLPLGLFASPELEAEMKASPFGQRSDLLCPFFDSVQMGCSVWTHRPGVCTTYFCKSERGADGLAFWADVESYLNHFEWSLANETLWRIGFTMDDLALCDHAMLTDESGPERDYYVTKAWAEWSDRRLELFAECARRAREITSNELNELLGDEALALEESLRERST